VKPRKYTGTSDGPAKAKRPGTEQFVREVCALSGGALWNNGTWVVRNMQGKTSLSVHATGRAMDLSWRGKSNGRKHAERIMDTLVANNQLLDVEMILDYWEGFGRGWRCDRQQWQVYDKPTITGAPGGDWIHVEISPRMADTPHRVTAAFAKVNMI
jgi:hypothetical protein